MDTTQLTALLQALLSAVANGEFDATVGSLLSEADLGGLPEVRRVSTFEEAGVLTRDDGLVVRMEDGQRFQVTVVDAGGSW